MFEAICQLAGLVRQNGGQCHLREGGLVDDTTLIGTVVASMAAEGIQHHCRTSETLVTYEPQLIMHHCPKVVDDSPFVLSIFAAPQAVSITGKMPEGIGIMNPF